MFDVVSAVDRYQAASRHMAAQTVDPVKIAVLAGFAVVGLLLIYLSYRDK